CVDCHEPHGQSYRDVSGRRLAGRFDDGQCLGCHASKAERTRAHTHHAPGSPGSRCVACHMPYLQQPQLGRALRYARSDHTISIPRPAFDAELPVQGACRQCHVAEPVRQLEARLVEWYGELKPLKARTFPMAQFDSLSRYFLEELRQPDMGSLDPGVRRSLDQLAAAPDLDVRALALMALHFTRGSDPEVRRVLAARLRGLPAEEDDALRRRWATALDLLGDSYRLAGEFASATTTYRKALEVLPEDAPLLVDLGTAYAGAGDYARAVDAYRRSLRHDPVQPLAFVNLGFALDQQGDLAGALRAYERALALEPNNALAYFSLGNAYLRHQRLDAAAAAYERAAELDPGLAGAHFSLAQVYGARRQSDKALAAARRGLAFEPDNVRGRQILAALERALGP
ncbi:MAG: tetratricopeptide repeat protein, partial [Gemmatimonadetes bacterium]|nr:tetratricopeptide repeat protein [Gemmatimonadota bacterium]